MRGVASTAVVHSLGMRVRETIRRITSRCKGPSRVLELTPPHARIRNDHEMRLFAGEVRPESSGYG